MVKLGKTKSEERSRASRYEQIGRSLVRTAEDLATIGEAKYGNGLAIMAIHAAITYTDALTVAFRETKSTDGDHTHAVSVLQHALGNRAPPEQIRRLRGILGAKSHASYSGTFYTLEDGARLLAETQAFIAWAEEMLRRRPP